MAKPAVGCWFVAKPEKSLSYGFAIGVACFHTRRSVDTACYFFSSPSPVDGAFARCAASCDSNRASCRCMTCM